METQTQKRRLTKHTAAIAIAGCALSSVVMVTLHGSRWPTALFILAGMFLPVPLALLLSRLSLQRIRWPGLLSLFLTTLGILTVAWLGKYPNPASAFKDSLRIAPPAGIQNLSARCGWFDGRVTVLRFTADVQTIRNLLPSGTEPQRFLESPGFQNLDERWRVMATGTGAIVDRSLRTFPGWKSPWCAQWSLPSATFEPDWVRIAWDDQTGQAIVVSQQ